MPGDTYLSGVLAKYIVNQPGVHAQVLAIHPVIARWGGTYLLETIYSGSIAKGTAVSLSTDADIFISLSSTTPDPLGDVYTTLNTALIQAGYQTKKQNVSIGVTAGGYKIDYVPGKRQS
jgi:tRNA nucleotidyltransferase (CCA-adding enzyme)